MISQVNLPHHPKNIIFWQKLLEFKKFFAQKVVVKIKTLTIGNHHVLDVRDRKITYPLMKETYIKLSYQIIFYLVAVAVAAMPLFFLPTASEFFEFNKFTLLLSITIVGYVVWAVRMVLEKKFSFNKTPLDLPVFLFVVVSFVATLASLDQAVSLFGASGKPWPSFISVATLGAFYFLATSNLKTRKQVENIFWALAATTTVAAAIAILAYFGIFLPYDFAKFRSFNTLGSPNSLALLEAFVLPFVGLWAVFGTDMVRKTVATAATVVLALSLILINFLPAYLGLLAAFIFIANMTLRAKLTKSARNGLILLGAFVAVFVVLRFVPQFSQNTLYGWIQNKTPGVSPAEQVTTPHDITLPQVAGWDIATSTIGKRPLFGTGPGTFQFAYTQLKPRYINATNLWTMRFDRSSSDFTEYMTTVGIVGVLAYLALAAIALRFIWVLTFKTKNSLYYLASAASLIVYIVAGFFGTSTLANATLFFFGLATLGILASAHEEKFVSHLTLEVTALRNSLNWFPLGGSSLGVLKTTDKNTTKSQVLPIVFLVLVLILGAFAAVHQVRAYQGEYFYRQAIVAARANNGNKAIQSLQKAITANPGVDLYHRALSQTTLLIALNLNQKKDLTDADKQLLTQLVSVSVDQAKVASGYQILPLRVPGISAPNVANWESLADSYQALIGSVTGAETHAVNALTQAVNLDPENVILHDKLGLLYQRLNSLDLAQRKFEDAAIIKTDYGPAHSHLAKVLIEKKGDVQRIATELTLAKQYLPKDDPAQGDIDKNLADYNKQLQDLQKQQAQQAVTPPPTPSPSPAATGSAVPKVSPLPSPTPGL